MPVGDTAGLGRIFDPQLLKDAVPSVDPALGPAPGALDHGVVVDPGEKVLFKVVKGAARLDLVDAEPAVKRLLGNAAVLELGEEDLAVLGQERARGVAVVHGVGVLALRRPQQVADEDGGLGGDGGGRLGRRQAGGVAGGPHVGVLLVPRRGVVDVDVAGLVGQGTVLDEGVGAHLGHDVQEVEALRDLLLSVGAGESGDVAVDGDEVVLEQALDAPLPAQLVKLGAVLGHAEHDWQTGGEADLDGGVGGRRLVEAGALPVIKRKPHDLLGRTGALDDAGGLCEDGAAGLELVDGAEDLVAVVVAVDGGDEALGVGEGLGQALDAAVVDADAGGDDELVVAQAVAAGEGKLVALGGKGADGMVVEADVGIDEGVEAAAQVLLELEAAADEGPAGLVVMPLGRVDDGDVVLGELAGAQQLVADGQAGAASADDDDAVAARDGVHGRSCREEPGVPRLLEEEAAARGGGGGGGQQPGGAAAQQRRRGSGHVAAAAGVVVVTRSEGPIETARQEKEEEERKGRRKRQRETEILIACYGGFDVRSQTRRGGRH